MITIFKKYFSLLSLLIASLLFNGCGAASPAALDALLASLTSTTQGSGPTFNDASLTGDQINTFATSVLEDMTYIVTGARSLIISESGLSGASGTVNVTVPATTNSVGGGTLTFSGSAAGTINPGVGGDLILTALVDTVNVTLSTVGVSYTGRLELDIDMEGSATGASTEIDSAEATFSISGIYGSKISLELVFTTSLTDPAATETYFFEGRLLIASGSDIYACPFSTTDITDPTFTLACNKI